MYSTQQHKESTFIPDQIASSPTLPEPRQNTQGSHHNDDASGVAHIDGLLLSVCKDFGLTIILMRTIVLENELGAPPTIGTNDYELDDVCQLTYIGSTITDNLSLDA